jgi:hypothetical protein
LSKNVCDLLAGRSLGSNSPGADAAVLSWSIRGLGVEGRAEHLAWSFVHEGVIKVKP